jgi:hypothetical protein
VETSAPETVHVGLTKSIQHANNFIFSLVNTTSSPVRPGSLLPVYDLRVKLNLNGKLKPHQILRSQGQASVTATNGVVELKLDKLEVFFAVHLTME